MKKDIEINLPKNQKYLYGYKKKFNYFIKLLFNKKLPNTLLFSGPKGIGKSTFVYHFVNYIFSLEEDHKYSLQDFKINEKNQSFKLVNSNIHPNFYLIEKDLDEKEVKIEKIRNLLKFINKSTYSRDLKFILIDDVENLNINSINALLKATEETGDNTYFFIIHNNHKKILDTIKSRCTDFKFYLNISEKKDILDKLLRNYIYNIDLENIDTNKIIDKFYFDTPGNLLKYLLILSDSKLDLLNDTKNCILFFIEKFKSDKKFDTMTYLSLFIEKYYSDLSLSNFSNNILTKKEKILNEIHKIKKFNLSEKNSFLWIKEIINEKTR